MDDASKMIVETMIKSENRRSDELILNFDMISEESLPHCV
jgi:hypothetical protein